MTTTTQPIPRASSRSDSRSGVAPVIGSSAQLVQTILYIVGAVLMPVGLVAIILGWYGAAHTPYEYDQLAYLVSGGLLGLGLTFVGGFLYFGAWLARIAADQRAASKQLADTLLVLADVVAQQAPSVRREPGNVLVVAGSSGTVHRADCDLVAGRTDLRPAGAEAAGLARCRLCNPVV